VDDLSRAVAFRHWLLSRSCPVQQRFDHGIVYLDPSFPLRHDSNLLVIDRRVAGVNANALHSEADRILGSRGLRHRKIAFDHEVDALRVAMDLAEFGYEGDTADVMVLSDGGIRASARSVRVAEMSFRDARPLILESIAREPFADNAEVIAQLTDARGALEERTGCRFFVAREAGGMMASACELYVEGLEAQIEDVMTLEEYRGAGLATTCVAAAAHAAREAGATWIHLYADSHDWPKEWYSRLGFRSVGVLREFTLWNASP
jgi:ribosomal protein S18 acetylase RimI-like enzyme